MEGWISLEVTRIPTEKEKASSKERTIAKYLGVELPENVDENEMSIVDKLND